MIFRRPATWAVLWALAILVLTLMPAREVPGWPWADRVQLDKWVHAFLFGVQCVLLGLALTGVWPQAGRTGTYIMATVVAVAYGGIIELLQESMGNGRHGDTMDLLADAAGVLLGYGYLMRRGARQANKER